jgi:hypothetical protein
MSVWPWIRSVQIRKAYLYSLQRGITVSTGSNSDTAQILETFCELQFSSFVC